MSTHIECAYLAHGACSYNARITGFNDCTCNCHITSQREPISMKGRGKNE